MWLVARWSVMQPARSPESAARDGVSPGAATPILIFPNGRSSGYLVTNFHLPELAGLLKPCLLRRRQRHASYGDVDTYHQKPRNFTAP